MFNRKEYNQRLDKAYQAYEAGRFAAAEKMYDKLRDDLRFYHSRSQRMNLLMGMSYVKSALGKHKEARAACEILVRNSRPRKGLYIALHQSALIEKEAGDERKALDFLNQEIEVLQKHKKIDSQKHAICQYERASTLRNLGLKQDALYALQDAARRADMARDEFTSAMVYKALGDMHLDWGDKDEAKKAYLKAKENFLEAEHQEGVKEVNEALKRL